VTICEISGQLNGFQLALIAESVAKYNHNDNSSISPTLYPRSLRNHYVCAAGVNYLRTNDITCVNRKKRDANKDGIAEQRFTFVEGMKQPFGIAFWQNYIYIGNTDAVIRFTYKSGLLVLEDGSMLIQTTPQTRSGG